MPHKTLQVLRQFWKARRHPELIFPNRKRGVKNAHLVDHPLERGGIQVAMKKVVEQMGLKKRYHVTLCATVMLPIYLMPGLI